MKPKDTGSVCRIIREEIIEDILSGIYRSGDMLPTQDYFAQKYAVSRLTVRKAVQDLVEKGILVTYKAKGTFVKDVIINEFGYRRCSCEGSETVLLVPKSDVKVIRKTVAAADKRVAARLEAQENEAVLLLERLRLIRNVITCYQKSYIRMALLTNAAELLTKPLSGSLYQFIQDHTGYAQAYTNEQYRAILCPPNVGALMSISENDPVLFVKSTTYAKDGTPLVYSDIYDRTDITGVQLQSV